MLIAGGFIERNDYEYRAVALGIAEYYLDAHNHNQFHYYVEPKK